MTDSHPATRPLNYPIIQLFNYATIRLYDHRTKNGLTLVELLVAMTIFSIVVTLTLTIFFNIQNTQRQFDKKYEIESEVNRILKEIETSLKSAQQLVSGTSRRIKFLNASNDTIEYYLENDILIKRGEPLTNLVVDSLCLTYIQVKEKEKITEFDLLDKNHDGILSGSEFIAISGVSASFQFSYFEKSKRMIIKKIFFIALRNFQSR